MTAPMHRHRVLIVEDEPLIRLALCRFLTDFGFCVLGAMNGDDAIRILKRVGRDIAAVMTDIRMPGMIDGIGVAEWAHRYYPGMPVILTSGDAGAVGRVVELHPRDLVLQKPYSLDQVAQEIMKRAWPKRLNPMR